MRATAFGHSAYKCYRSHALLANNATGTTANSCNNQHITCPNGNYTCLELSQPATMNPNDEIASQISSSIKLEVEGKQHGHLSLPHSSNESAWGSVRIPITVIKNGSGPTVTLIAGNHGDEYEGPLALLKLANELNLEDINGRLILLPCLNAPAVASASRLSPIDNKNMNRCFPGDSNGSITDKIADYISTSIIPESDYVLDLHSGGKTLDFIPLAAVHFLADRQLQEKAENAMIAFGAPNSLRMRELDDRGMLDTMVETAGKVFVTTELRGGGTVTRESLQIAETGCRNFLVHTGILQQELVLASTRMLEMPEENCFVVADCHGMLEMCSFLGGPVYKGSVIARVHDFENTGRAPREFIAGRDGILMARHFPGLITPGDCLAVIAEEVPR